MEDLQSLQSQTDASLLEALEARHAAKHVYTYSGPRVVVSINPYDWAISGPLYTEEVRGEFRDASEGDLSGGRRALAPHLYAVAEQARRRRATPGNAQALVVGGESGGGKTEAVKILMQYLCETDQPHRSRWSARAHLVDRLVELNPLLEAFGNARTALNHNSSRFGKLITLQYEESASAEGALGARIVGGYISSYLLEKVPHFTTLPDRRACTRRHSPALTKIRAPHQPR
jgi:myosin heavy subunit